MLFNQQMEGKDVQAKDKRKVVNKRLHAIDESGTARVGMPLRKGDIYINKKIPVIRAEYHKKGMMYNIKTELIEWKDEPDVFKNNKPLYVDRMIFAQN